jgi:putative nucleotidyltransferase with HDIG domain
MELSKKMGPTAHVFELCHEFDEAVEFAALEGDSIVDAIAAFASSAGGRADLARLAGYGSARIDIAAMSLPVMPKQASLLLRGKGIPEVRRILLAACFSGLFAAKPLRDLWEHSIAVARVAGDLAHLAGIDAEMAYVAGLLHDIGRLGFRKLRGKLRIQEQEWLSRGFPLVYAETLAYGLDHAALGAHCLRAWELPEIIVEAVLLHHRPECSGSPLGAVLTLAEDLTARSTNTPSEDLWSGMRRTAACLTAGITLDQFEEYIEGGLT